MHHIRRTLTHWLCSFFNFWHYRIDPRGRWWISRRFEATYLNIVGGPF